MAKESKIVSLDDEEQQTPAIPATSEAVVQVAGSNFDAELCGDRELIEIFEGDQIGGRDAVPVQVNGFAYQIPRNKVVSVPVEVLYIIENAKYMITTKEGSNDVVREVKRFSYQKHGKAA